MRRQQRRVGAGLALALVTGLALTTAVVAATASAGAGGVIDWAPYASGLVEPIDLAVTGVPTDTRLFVAERDGRIKIVLDTGEVLTTTFLDFDDVVNGEDNVEEGLFGITFDPDYANNGAFYVYYNDNNGDMQLSRYQVSSDPNVALTTEVKVLTIPHPAELHNGGDIDFGHDGYLYLTPGDGGDGWSNNGQDMTTLLGKVLRLDVTAQPTYTVPATNPYTQTVGVLPEIWARGLRNAFRFSFDQLTGDLYLADVGEASWEEVNYRPADSPGGEDYGWGCYEGTQVYHLAEWCQPLEDTTLPIFAYSRSVGTTVIGGYVYRGAAYPFLDGYYFFADFTTRQFWALNTGTHTAIPLGQMLTPGEYPVTFGQDALGELYLAEYLAGTIYKMVGLGAPEEFVYLPLILR